MFDDKDKLLRRSMDSIGWMIDDIKWRCDIDKPGDEGSGGYSPELTRAMELRKELEEYFKQGSDNGRRQDAQKTHK